MRVKSSLHCTFAAASIAFLAATAADGISTADARSLYYEDEAIEGTPLLAVFGLSEQRVTIYAEKGKMLESPVSSGQTGLETPAGIYSVVQKEEDHHSNIYDDASMPYMERITWTGIALHGGVLPGYPASHGCVRMPESFAEKLYGLTELGMRVVVVREDIAPAPIAQPALFTRKSAPKDGSGNGDEMQNLRAIFRAAISKAESAKWHEKEVRQAAAKKSAEAAAAAKSLHAAEAELAKAEEDLKAAGRTLEAADEAARPHAQEAQAQALAKVETLKAKAETAGREAQGKADEAARAEADIKSAAAATTLAADAAEEAELNLSPVSVLISRKTQRLYVRQNNKPVYEAPVTILDKGKPIGSFVFTALAFTGTPGELRWNVVSMYKDAASAAPLAHEGKGRTKAVRDNDAAPADVAGAEAALKRVAISEEAAARISEAVLPGASLIISDEGPSIETGKDTDFVVVMSGEPQGGLAIRHHQTASRHDADFNFFGGQSFFGGTPERPSNNYSRSYGRPSSGSGGSGFPFFFGQ